MPWYDYICNKCRKEFEAERPMEKSNFAPKPEGLIPWEYISPYSEPKPPEEPPAVRPECPNCHSNKDVRRNIKGTALRGVK